ncbi:hypothetical protein GYMLUDRAFT_41119 [Collybiopsis luxurians FD-317 M1]|uniref:F-box domain-containing protein n=1 Tax=Collybiopsis luxurians FD-317 M1 TaxID=944289 RepID=A0A0D0CKK8_9AGAR|nr:hypothetical protein GYMLUDRAFT_41119 [Collybiopsis luxurians FD-317 M1]
MRLCSRCGENVSESCLELDFTSLHAKLRSEYGPASVQLDEVHRILGNLHQDLKVLESASLEIETHRSCILEYGAQIQSLLAPVRKIPNEILQQIFDECCDMNYFVVSKPSPTSVRSLRRKPAMAISSVCSRWRTIAFSMPQMWTGISLEWNWDAKDDMDDFDKLEHQNLFFPLTTFLGRSLELPLVLDFVLKATPKFPNNSLHPFMAQLERQTYRWQSLSFHSERFNLKNLFSRYEFPHLPLLNNLGPIDDFVTIHSIGKDVVPRLNSLGVEFFFPDAVEFPKFPFTQILHLELREVGDCQVVGPPEDPQFVTFPSMRSLTVRLGKTNPVNLFRSIFSFLRAPLLGTLHLEASNSRWTPGSWSNIGPFLTFVQRSSCPLTTLSIKSIPLSDSDLVHLVRLVPTLHYLTVTETDLVVEDSSITDRFIESLHASRTSLLRPQAEPLVPRLRSLTLETRTSGIYPHIVVDMVCSRWIPSAISYASGKPYPTEVVPHPVDCLREFILRIWNPEHKDLPEYIEKPLESLERCGMRLHVGAKGD